MPNQAENFSMKVSVLTAVWLLLASFTSGVKATYLPTLIWSSNNQLFSENKALCVKQYDSLIFVCPNLSLLLRSYTSGELTDLKGAPKKIKLYENLWFVDQEGYETCKINLNKKENKLVKTCKTSDNAKIAWLRVQININQADPELPRFKYNQMHYYISTANGTLGSLNNLEGGHCTTDNMRLKVFFYKTDNCLDCSEGEVRGKRLDYFFCEPRCTESQDGTLKCRMNWLVDREISTSVTTGSKVESTAGPESLQRTGFFWIPDKNHRVSLYRESPQNVVVQCPTNGTSFIIEHENTEFCQNNPEFEHGKVMTCSDSSQELMASTETPSQRCFSLWTNSTGEPVYKASLIVDYHERADSTGSVACAEHFGVLSAAALLFFLYPGMAAYD